MKVLIVLGLVVTLLMVSVGPSIGFIGPRLDVSTTTQLSTGEDFIWSVSCVSDHSADAVWNIGSVDNTKLCLAALDSGGSKYQVLGPNNQGSWLFYLWSGTNVIQSDYLVTLKAHGAEYFVDTLRYDGLSFGSYKIKDGQSVSFRVPTVPAKSSQYRTLGTKGTVTIAETPEPGGFVALLVGVIGICPLARRR